VSDSTIVKEVDYFLINVEAGVFFEVAEVKLPLKLSYKTMVHAVNFKRFGNLLSLDVFSGPCYSRGLRSILSFVEKQKRSIQRLKF
jgi:hypothetical protein